jgi:hypothetical protein
VEDLNASNSSLNKKNITQRGQQTLAGQFNIGNENGHFNMQQREHTPATVSVASPNTFLDFTGECLVTDQRVINATALFYIEHHRNLARAARLVVRTPSRPRPPAPPIRAFRRSLAGRSAPDGEDAPC